VHFVFFKIENNPRLINVHAMHDSRISGQESGAKKSIKSKSRRGTRKPWTKTEVTELKSSFEGKDAGYQDFEGDEAHKGCSAAKGPKHRIVNRAQAATKAAAVIE
jgi:hypothetical protein